MPISYNPRRRFGDLLHEAMQKDPDIWVLTGDLGYKVFDPIIRDFSDRFVNVGAEEHVLLGAGIGLALDGKKPICYSITPFMLLRGAEYLRNYLDYEQIPVKLVGSGLDKDYEHDGISHFMFNTEQYMSYFTKIKTLIPERNQDSMDSHFKNFIQYRGPTFLGIRR